MLLTIEKVIILKGVSIFSETPDEVLAEVAGILDVVDVKAGESVIQKGDMGRSMYVIVDGKVQVHDEDRIIANLGEREVFGELSALDPEPRLASVTALVDSRFFRLDHFTLYEFMTEHIAVAKGIIAVLCKRLRGQPKT